MLLLPSRRDTGRCSGAGALETSRIRAPRLAATYGGLSMSRKMLVLTVRIDAGEGFAGSIGSRSSDVELAFSGWVGFIEAIEVLRARARSANTGHSPDASSGGDC